MSWKIKIPRKVRGFSEMFFPMGDWRGHLSEENYDVLRGN